MKKIAVHSWWALAALLLVVLVAVLYPFCRYYIDPDAVAYFSVIRRYAAGDYAQAVNGYWSPLSCWLCALLLKAGLPEMPAAVAVNTMAALGVMGASHALFRFFNVEARPHRWLPAALAVFLAYAVYQQLFADLWEVFFLLLQLRLLLDERFPRSVLLWVLLGCLGAWAYYAKAYAFPFFFLQTIVLGWVRFRGRRRSWMGMLCVSSGVLLLWAFPWMWLLHAHYGRWMTSTAGGLNLSWYLVGHPYYRDGIVVLLPPPYPGSPFCWEDPYLVNGPAPGWYSSAHLFLLQIVRLGLNFLKCCNSLAEQSVFMLLLYAIAVGAVFRRRIREWLPVPLRWMALSMLLFPLGFWLINFEARYIWYLLPCGMILGSWLLEQLRQEESGKALKSWLAAVFALSFVVWPLWDLKRIAGTGREEYRMAALLKRQGVQGSFAANAGEGEGYRSMARLAYFSGNAYYYTLPVPARPAALLAELRRYHIRYYIHLHHVAEAEGYRLTDGNGVPFPEVAPGFFPGMQVFRLRP